MYRHHFDELTDHARFRVLDPEGNQQIYRSLASVYRVSSKHQ